LALSDDLALLADNSTGDISPADLRAALQSIYDALNDDADFDGTVTTALAAKVSNSLFDANTILAANSDNTPAALTVAEQRLVGRITGGSIDDLTASQVLTLLGTTAVPDAALTDYDLTGELADLYGGTIDLGTSGAITFRYRRVGRMVEGWLWIGADDDATYGSGGPLYFPGTSLPVAPRLPNANPAGGSSGWGSPGGFGFFSAAEAGFQFGASPAIVNVGSVAMVFSKTDTNTGGLASIVTDASPQDLTTNFWTYSGYVVYEADTAA